MFKESKVNDKLIILGLLKDKRNIYIEGQKDPCLLCMLHVACDGQLFLTTIYMVDWN